MSGPEHSRVVVTGLGLMLALGASAEEAWQRGLDGMSAIGPLRRFDATGHACTAAAEIGHVDLQGQLRNPKNQKFMNKGTQCAMRAASEAVLASRIDLLALDPYRVGVHVGSGQTGLECDQFFAALAAASDGSDEADFARLGGFASHWLDPYFSLRTMSNAGTALIAAEFDARGPSSNFVQSDTASAMALESAWYDLTEHRCDVAIAGGYDSLISVSSYLVYEKAGLLSSAAPDEAYRPFDRRRDGLVLGEGAGFFVMERLTDAIRRGAPVLGEIVGVDCAMEAADNLEPKVSLAPLQRVVTSATQGQPVDVVFAHGIGTPEGDRREADMLRTSFGGALPITALKGQTGYLGAATAAVEVAFALMSVSHGWIPPIARHSDSEFALDFVNEARAFEAETPLALCLAWSWAGQVSAVAVQRWPSACERQDQQHQQNGIDGQ